MCDNTFNTISSIHICNNICILFVLFVFVDVIQYGTDGSPSEETSNTLRQHTLIQLPNVDLMLQDEMLKAHLVHISTNNEQCFDTS